jgi:hypothetical protein
MDVLKVLFVYLVLLSVYIGFSGVFLGYVIFRCPRHMWTESKNVGVVVDFEESWIRPRYRYAKETVPYLCMSKYTKPGLHIHEEKVKWMCGY